MQAPLVFSERPGRIALFAALVLGTMVPATIVIPVMRAFVARAYPNAEWLVHAFMAVNLLGACLFGPLFAVHADRTAKRRAFAGVLAVLDGLMLVGVALEPPLPLMLFFRFVQGAASVGAVSILMGAARGQARSGAISGTSMGLIGASVVFAIVLGIPLGAVLGRGGPAVPLFVGGAIGIATGLVALLAMPRAADVGSSTVSLPHLLTRYTALRGPTLVVGLERMAVGAFVVTLQLHGHHVLKVSDATVSMWFSVFLVAFGCATWPLTHFASRFNLWRVVASGGVVYGAVFIALGFVPTGVVTPVLLAGGVASAAMYGPALLLASKSVPPNARGSAMAVLNAAGTLGMFVGNVTAFALASGLVEAGLTREQAYQGVFAFAGMVQAISVLTGLTNGKTKNPATPTALAGSLRRS